MVRVQEGTACNYDYDSSTTGTTRTIYYPYKYLLSALLSVLAAKPRAELSPANRQVVHYTWLHIKTAPCAVSTRFWSSSQCRYRQDACGRLPSLEVENIANKNPLRLLRVISRGYYSGEIANVLMSGVHVRVFRVKYVKMGESAAVTGSNSSQLTQVGIGYSTASMHI